LRTWPQEAEDEISGLDEARKQVAELERQIKHLKSESEAQQIDRVAVERAVKSAVERERFAWQRKLEQGRARFRQMTAALASTGQSLAELKELLEDAEHERPAQHTAGTALEPLQNHRPERTAKRANERVASAESLDGALKLAAGERRILPALAQYPQGRSKVQVAVLTGYAAAGGGFNDYLGALHSRGLLQGDGDRLTITDTGIQTLASWEPLPTGSALIDYWRNRLGKGGAANSENAYPGVSRCSHQRGCSVQRWLRGERRRFQQRPRPAEDVGARARARRSSGKRQSVRFWDDTVKTG
jgi:hypothetical protein